MERHAVLCRHGAGRDPKTANMDAQLLEMGAARRPKPLKRALNLG